MELPGFDPSVAQVHTQSSKDVDTSHLVYKRSWEIALGPIKQLPMNLFIMYMAGNSISIFPIMMVGMFAVRPFKVCLPMSLPWTKASSRVLSRYYSSRYLFTLLNINDKNYESRW